MVKIHRVSQKNALSESYWTHSAMAQTPVADTPLCLEINFWSFPTKTKQDQALPSHVHGKVWPHSAQFRLWFLSISTFFWDTLYYLPWFYSTLYCHNSFRRNTSIWVFTSFVFLTSFRFMSSFAFLNFFFGLTSLDFEFFWCLMLFLLFCCLTSLVLCTL